MDAVFHFQSLRSGSGGNCLLAWTQQCAILIDCGISTQRDCLSLLQDHAHKLVGVVVSHAHGDHICYSSLKVLEKLGKSVHCHERVKAHVHRKHCGDWPTPPMITTFGDQSFKLGDFEIHPVEVPHEPRCPTFGFVIYVGTGEQRRKMVVCTDFHDHNVLLDHIDNADFVFVEANHDLDLLRKYFNYASLFHLNNIKTADLLCTAAKLGQFKPQHVMLGHLSDERNTEELALKTVKDRFAKDGLPIEFTLDCAPAKTTSAVISIH